MCIRDSEETGCDAIMIGRAALGNPWLIKQVVESLEHGTEIPEPTYKEKIAWCLTHAKRLMTIEPERIAMSQMRGHAPWSVSYTHLTLPTKRIVEI